MISHTSVMAPTRGKCSSRRRQKGHGIRRRRCRCKCKLRRIRRCKPGYKRKCIRRRRMRGRGAVGDFFNRVKAKAGSVLDATKERFKPFAKRVAKDTLLPLGKDILLGRKPTAEGVAKTFTESVKRNALKEIQPYMSGPVAARKRSRLPMRRRTVRRRF